jgi:hypothetical protein
VPTSKLTSCPSKFEVKIRRRTKINNVKEEGKEEYILKIKKFTKGKENKIERKKIKKTRKNVKNKKTDC